MRGWMIPLFLLLVLLLLCQIRIGVRGEYSDRGIEAWARLGRITFKVFPMKERAPKKKKAKKPPKETEPKKRDMGGTVELAKSLLPVVLDVANRFRKKLRVDTLLIRVTAGAPDPADAAMIYGRTYAALGATWGALNQALHIVDGRASVELDFDSDTTTVYISAALSLTVGQILYLALCLGMKGLPRLLRVRRQRKQKETPGKAV